MAGEGVWKKPLFIQGCSSRQRVGELDRVNDSRQPVVHRCQERYQEKLPGRDVNEEDVRNQTPPNRQQ